MRNSFVIPLVISACLTAAGCAHNQAMRDPAYAAIAPPLPSLVSSSQNPGAIYQPGVSTPLFADLTARQIGDILTVNLVESTSAQKAADTEVTRDQTAELGNPTVLGQEVRINPLSGLPLTPGYWNLSGTLSSSSEFAGGGTSTQSNQLSGTISVTVAQVLANGNLVVQGEKVVTLNRGDEFIRFRGIVRPYDIAPDNSIDSTQVANAEIIYSGRGELANANRMGWLARFFNSLIWPF